MAANLEHITEELIQATGKLGHAKSRAERALQVAKELSHHLGPMDEDALHMASPELLNGPAEQAAYVRYMLERTIGRMEAVTEELKSLSGE